MPFVLSPRAQADLGDIWHHTERQWGRNQAERYIRRIESMLALLAANPALGRAVDTIRLGYRKHSCGSHVIFYRQMDTGIDVVRILHQRMDIERHL
jgi:toxin ParE1/3/4